MTDRHQPPWQWHAPISRVVGIVTSTSIGHDGLPRVTTRCPCTTVAVLVVDGVVADAVDRARELHRDRRPETCTHLEAIR